MNFDHIFKSGWLMRIVERADGREFIPGVYLRSYNPDGNDGHGEFGFTQDKNEALRFTSVGEAMELWKRVSTVRPTRMDGKPNRPLTMYTVTFDPYDEKGDLHAAVNLSVDHIN